jgi:hypothetical protein
MNTTVLIIVGILAVVAVAATLYALNRSWGDFGRSSRIPPAGPSALGTSDPAARRSPGASWERPEPPAAEARPSAAPYDSGGLVPIDHSMVRRAAEQALARGGPAARYIVRQGDSVYFDFSQIADADKRQQAYDLMRRFNEGQDVDIQAMLRLVRELFQ